MGDTGNFGDTRLMPSSGESYLRLRSAITEEIPVSRSKAVTTFPGKVEKVIRPQPQTGEPEKAQISVEGADHLYKEIRVPNQLVNNEGQKVKLKPGAEVDVTIEAEPAKDTVPATEEAS